MTKQEAAQDFIKAIDKGDYSYFIVENSGEYFAQNILFDGDRKVYSYGQFWASNANLIPEDISSRF